MPAILFNNVWMLAGLLALSIPIIVHLLLRRKKKRLRFSTIQFFVKQDEQSSQRRKLRNWLLLALRLLICALLVFAFARPYLGNGAAAGAGPGKRQVVIVLDRSLSMQANAADGPKWSRARESVRQILSDLGPNDRAALVSCAQRAEVLSEWAPAGVVSKRLDDLQPAYSTANLGEGLQQAARLLSFGDPKASSIIYAVSDLQQSSAQNLSAFPVPRQAEVKLIKVGDLVTPNLAVADLQIETREDVKPHALIVSYSDEDNPELKLEVSVDGQVAASPTVALNAGGTTNVELALPLLKPGWHDVAVRLRGHDALALDDARCQTTFVPEPARVLVAEGRPSKRSFEQESFFILAALDPGSDSTNGITSRFTCEKVALDGVAGKLTGRANGLPYDVVVLPGLKQIPSALGPVLSSYLQAGGGVLLFTGEGVSANRYNTEFREWLPVQLGAVESKPEYQLGWRISEYQTNTMLFGAFQLPNSGDLSLARFTKRFVLPNPDQGLVAARFEDSMPLVVLREFGRGRVVLVNTSVDTSWNDWPKHKTFVPWLHGTAQYLAALAMVKPSQSQTDWLAGNDADIELGSAAAKGEFKLRSPDNKETTVRADDQGHLRDAPLSMPGVYALHSQNGTEVRRWAVNLPIQESDLTALSPNDFHQQIARSADTPDTTLTAGLFGSGSNQKEMWRVLLMAVLVLLFVEMLVANRTLA